MFTTLLGLSSGYVRNLRDERIILEPGDIIAFRGVTLLPTRMSFGVTFLEEV